MRSREIIPSNLPSATRTDACATLSVDQRVFPDSKSRQRNTPRELRTDAPAVVTRVGGLLAGLLVVQLTWALLTIGGLDEPVAGATDASVVSSVRELGRVLFERHGFAFEATSILILVAMVGAVVLARRAEEAP